jgi:hypothetical protein
VAYSNAADINASVRSIAARGHRAFRDDVATYLGQDLCRRLRLVQVVFGQGQQGVAKDVGKQDAGIEQDRAGAEKLIRAGQAAFSYS